MEPFNPDVMLKQVADLGNLLRLHFKDIDNGVNQALPPEVLRQAQAVYVFGDGDSLHAALASEMVFGEFSRTAYFPREAMRFLEYGADYLDLRHPSATLVIGISASGGSIRVIDALQRTIGLHPDLRVVGMVGNPASKVADMAGRVISTQVPNMGASPGIRTYAASLMGLLALALRLGHAKGHLSDEDLLKLHQEIIGLAPLIEQTAHLCLEPARKAADEFHDAAFFSMVGSGPSYGSAIFSGAKLVEAAGIFAVGQDLEEWAHVEGLAYPLDYPVYMIAPRGKSYWRAEKLAVLISLLGHPLLLVAAQDDTVIHSKARYLFPLVGEFRESFSPLLTHIPASLFGCFLAEKAGRLPFMLDNHQVAERSRAVSSSIKTRDSGEI